MLLALEVGNSTVAAGVFGGPEPLALWHTPTHPREDPSPVLDAWLAELPALPTAAVVAGVVPAAVADWQVACARVLPSVRVVGDDLPVPLANRYRGNVGIDRLVDAYAAAELYGAPVLVADCGTATTLEVVGPEGSYRGGAILCGLGLQRDALAQRTALLPAIEPAPPARAIGDDTLDCLQSGLVLGHAGAIAGLVERMRAELGAPQAPLIGTGGWAPLLSQAVPELFTVTDPLLTLRGLCLCHTRGVGEVA